MLERFMSVAAAALMGAAAIGLPTLAHAQGLIFDWGGEKTADSGKQRIKFKGPGKAGDIIVSFTDRKLYYITAAGEADTYPIAIPREKSRWEGITSVTQKRENPSWTPTSNMLKENPKLPRWVPGGHPMNPLGYKALYLGSSEYRIHGTDAPWTIGTAASKGCVRMFNKDVDDLYPRVKVGSKVTVTWQQFNNLSTPMKEGEKLAIVGEDEKRPVAATPVAAADGTDQGLTPARGLRAKSRAAAAPKEAEKLAAVATAPVAATPAVAQDEPPVKAKRVKAAQRDELSPSTPRPEAGLIEKPEAAAVPQQVAKVEDVASAAQAQRDDRAARKVRSKPKSIVETGSIAPDAAKPDVAKLYAAPKAATEAKASNDDIVQRALAAAERAAASAERAAAAADRALAAIEQRNGAPKPGAAPTATP
jgi:lipoprotein-anchoring transpeptidase ErfK/SrfK